MKHRFLFALALAVLAPAAKAQDVAAFYKGKTINLIISTSPGGDYDVRARLVGRHIGRHIPGSPTVLPQNMPGSGGIRAANYLYNGAARDGTAMLAVMQQIPLTQVFKLSGVEFDLARGHYIGNTSSSPIVVASWHTSPVKTVEQSIASELIIGASGAGSASTQIPAMLNATIGTKFKVIAGYPGGTEIYLAMERGEVAGRGTQSLAGWKAQKADWIADRKLNWLAQGGFTRHPELPDVPLLIDYAKTPEDRQIVELFMSPDEISRPFLAGPGVPEDRVAALRRAFDAVMKDEAFMAEAKAMKIEINPMTGEQAESIVQKLLNLPPTVVAKAKAFSAEE